jgi:predicted DNA binding protein
MAIKLFECDCEYQESGTGTAKGYILVSECAKCVAKREADNAARLVKEAEEKVVVDAKAEAKESARAKLVKLGLTDAEIEALTK